MFPPPAPSIAQPMPRQKAVGVLAALVGAVLIATNAPSAMCQTVCSVCRSMLQCAAVGVVRIAANAPSAMCQTMCAVCRSVLQYAAVCCSGSGAHRHQCALCLVPDGVCVYLMS